MKRNPNLAAKSRRQQLFDPRSVLTNMPAIGFAFHTDPANPAAPVVGGAQAPAPANPVPAAATVPATTPTEAPAFDPDNFVAKDRVQQLIQERASRATQAATNQFNQELIALGVEGGLEGLKAQIAKANEAETARLVEEKRYQELYERTVQEKDRIIAEKEAAFQDMVSRNRQERLNNMLMAAAQDSVNPAQVAQLVAGRVQMDEQGNPYIVDELGSRMTDGQGNILTIDGFVERFLTKNPHFRKAAAGNGTAQNLAGNNVPPAPTTGPGQLDLVRANNDPEYFQENLDEIRRLIESGQISQ